MKVLMLFYGDYKDADFYMALIKKADFIICADGGGDYLYRWGVKPDLLIGDMDSISREALNYFEREGVRIERFPRDKDYTDSHLALLRAMDLSPSEIVMVGGLGDRMDHDLANLHLLYLAFKRGFTVKMVNEVYEAQVICEGLNRIAVRGSKISLIPLTYSVSFEYSEGLKWKLDGLTLFIGNPLGVSNEPQGEEIAIKVKEGCALLFQIRGV